MFHKQGLVNGSVRSLDLNIDKKSCYLNCVKITLVDIYERSPSDKKKNNLRCQVMVLSPVWSRLTLKHRETHGCVVSTVATDALVLKHQAISILSTD